MCGTACDTGVQHARLNYHALLLHCYVCTRLEGLSLQACDDLRGNDSCVGLQGRFTPLKEVQNTEGPGRP